MLPFGLTRRDVVVLGLGLLAILAIVGMRLAPRGAGQASGRPAAIRASRALKSTPAPAAAIVVDVAGAVRRPGLYRLRSGDRVADVVRRAGGATRRADLAAINLAAPAVDGSQILVPARAAAVAPTSAGEPSSAAPAGAKVSLSSATVEQLDALPGIGPVTAQKIVDWRTAHGAFRSVEALDEVPGIGPARIAQLKDLVTR